MPQYRLNKGRRRSDFGKGGQSRAMSPDQGAFSVGAIGGFVGQKRPREASVGDDARMGNHFEHHTSRKGGLIGRTGFALLN